MKLDYFCPGYLLKKILANKSNSRERFRGIICFSLSVDTTSFKWRGRPKRNLLCEISSMDQTECGQSSGIVWNSPVRSKGNFSLVWWSSHSWCPILCLSSFWPVCFLKLGKTSLKKWASSASLLSIISSLGSFVESVGHGPIRRETEGWGQWWGKRHTQGDSETWRDAKWHWKSLRMYWL